MATNGKDLKHAIDGDLGHIGGDSLRRTYTMKYIDKVWLVVISIFPILFVGILYYITYLARVAYNMIINFGEVDLLNTYSSEFGQDNVCWAQIEDFHLCDITTLKEQILPFLKDSDVKGERVVVHCSGGSGRTGHVLAAWLVFRRRLPVEDALENVRNTDRNPYEAAAYGNATKEELYALLRQCQKGNVA